MSTTNPVGPEGPAGIVTTDQATAARSSLSGEPGGGGRRRSWLRVLGVKRLSAVYLWVFFIVLFGLITPDTFLTETTFRLVFHSGVVTCVLALAFLVPLTAGGYDLSIGAVMSLSFGIIVYLSIHTGIPTPVAALLALLLSAFCGFVSGFIVVRLHVNSFIATLGVSQLLFGVVLLITSNAQLVGNLPQSWSNLGNNNLLGIPIVVYFADRLSARVVLRVGAHAHRALPIRDWRQPGRRASCRGGDGARGLGNVHRQRRDRGVGRRHLLDAEWPV